MLPTIVKGIPMRLRGISVSINKQGFLLQPDQLRRAGDELDAHGLTLGATAQSLSTPVPGRQLQRAEIQADVQGDDEREDVESERREP